MILTRVRQLGISENDFRAISGVPARTRVCEQHTEWGVRRRRLLLTEIGHVERVTEIRYTLLLTPRPVWILWLVRKGGKRLEIPGGTRELGRCFRELVVRYAKP